MPITIYILCWNEELVLPFTLNFYLKMFPSATIIIIDNESTDKTVEIAKSAGCEIYPYTSNNELSDTMYQAIKNNIWKHAKTDWVLICDCDEHLCINELQLEEEMRTGVTLIRGWGYNMVNMNNDINLKGIDHGYRDKQVAIFYDKTLLFNKNHITEMNYNVGAHSCIPVGFERPTTSQYILKHYKYINPDFMVARYKLYKERLSPDNLKNGFGGNYLETENTIRVQFEEVRLKSKKIE